MRSDGEDVIINHRKMRTISTRYRHRAVYDFPFSLGRYN